MANAHLSRREFLRLSGMGMAGVLLRPQPGWLADSEAAGYALLPDALPQALPEFPQTAHLGRVIGGTVAVKAKPDIDSADVATIYDDEVVPWLNETVGRRPLWYSQRFVETDQGYVYAPNLQPVRNLPNQPLQALPAPDGFWAEVTVPYVDLALDNPPARSPWVKTTLKPRLYYSQVMFIDQVQADSAGKIWYRVKEKYGTFGDIFWADAAAFRPIDKEEITPIAPEVEDKQVVVNLLDQSMVCLENGRESYYCRVSTGGKWDAEGNPSEKWATPPGAHSIWRKLVSVHMTGGSSGGGYDLAGIGWTTLFSSNGVAVHSTFWHNSFGIPKSHGCVNAQPEDAKWVFRWTNPGVEYDPGDQTISGTGSTKVLVVES